MRILFAAIALLWLWPGTGLAEPDPEPAQPGAQRRLCIPTSAVAERVAFIGSVDDGHRDRLTGSAVAVAVERLNAEPPATDFVADELWVLESPSLGPIVVLGLEGCAVATVQLAWRSYHRIFGRGS
jgi:hypothetical protein